VKLTTHVCSANSKNGSAVLLISHMCPWCGTSLNNIVRYCVLLPMYRVSVSVKTRCSIVAEFLYSAQILISSNFLLIV
jgi:hypothetical protein